MIRFQNLNQSKPYQIFKEKYDEAFDCEQKNIEAISISSYNREKDEVDSRFVNLKFIEDKNFIFFSNYNSPKANAFKSCEQISALFFWSSTNVQIRMKAKIIKTTKKYNNEYFKKRYKDKNALAISSNQSKIISSYEEVIERFRQTQEKEDLTVCPNYWGGFSFTPYYFEFWEGHDSRINKRFVYEEIENDWIESILQP